MMAKFDAPTRIAKRETFVIPVVIKTHLFPKVHVIIKVTGHLPLFEYLDLMHPLFQPRPRLI